MTGSGFDSARLARIGGFIDETYIAPGKLAGVDIAVLRGQKLAWRHITGLADAERGAALKDDAIWRIYSMTKPLTSVALMMLVEEGRIGLDDPVARYIPAWRSLKVEGGGAAAPMRVIDLMRHTSGLTYGFQERGPVDALYRALRIGGPDSPVPLDDFIRILSDLPLVFSPGSAWNYSVSTDVVAYLVQQVSGMAFEDFLKSRILAPLGMNDTGFSVPQKDAGRLAACYATREDGTRILQDDPATSRYLQPPVFVSGGGGLVSTTADYLQFCRMTLGRGTLGGVRFISRKTLDLMGANHIPGGRDVAHASISLFSETNYEGVGFGLGFATTIDPARTLLPGSKGDLAWGGMASTYFWVDPAEDIAVVLMTQMMPSSVYPIRRQVRTLVYAALN